MTPYVILIMVTIFGDLFAAGFGIDAWFNSQQSKVDGAHLTHIMSIGQTVTGGLFVLKFLLYMFLGFYLIVQSIELPPVVIWILVSGQALATCALGALWVARRIVYRDERGIL